MKIIPLSDVDIGESVYLRTIECCDCRQRLINMGFTAGARIVPLHKSLSKDPTAYYVRGAVVALRNSDAANIMCTEAEV